MARAAGAAVRSEPTHLFPGTAKRPDLEIANCDVLCGSGDSVLVDYSMVNITSPTHRGKAPGAASEAVELAKRAKYESGSRTLNATFIPAAQEHFGRMGAGCTRLVKKLAEKISGQLKGQTWASTRALDYFLQKMACARIRARFSTLLARCRASYTADSIDGILTNYQRRPRYRRRY